MVQSRAKRGLGADDATVRIYPQNAAREAVAQNFTNNASLTDSIEHTHTDTRIDVGRFLLGHRDVSTTRGANANGTGGQRLGRGGTGVRVDDTTEQLELIEPELARTRTRCTDGARVRDACRQQ